MYARSQPMDSQRHLSGPAAHGILKVFCSKCQLGEHSDADCQQVAASCLEERDRDAQSSSGCPGSSAFDESFDSGDSSCPSFWSDESESDSDCGEGEVSSPLPGVSTRPVQQERQQHQRASTVVTGTPGPQLVPAVPLPLDWLAQRAIPTTSDLDEALRSNGQLAYVPASSAAPAATSLLLPSEAKLLSAQVGSLSYMQHPCWLHLGHEQWTCQNFQEKAVQMLRCLCLPDTSQGGGSRAVLMLLALLLSRLCMGPRRRRLPCSGYRARCRT